MSIKVPYTYTKYEHSKLATAFDEMCHSSSKVVCGFIVSMALLLYFYYCVSEISFLAEIRSDIIGIAGIICILLWIASFFLGIICDKFELSRKIAVWDIKRKAGIKSSPKKRLITLAIIVAILALPAIAALIF